MRQYARFPWRVLALVTGNIQDPDRKWANQDIALSDLISEGWIIDGPHGKQPTIKHSADWHFYGYGLRRTVH